VDNDLTRPGGVTTPADTRDWAQPGWSWTDLAAAYRAAAHSGGSALRGHPIRATWDPELSDTMLAVGRKIEEEQTLSALLADLSGQP